MKATTQTIALAGLGLAAVLFTAAPATAETINYKADLKPTSEVPPNNTTGSGSLTATYDTNTKALNWTATYSGLSGPAIMSHFHGPADPSVNAGTRFRQMVLQHPHEPEQRRRAARPGHEVRPQAQKLSGR